MSTVVSLQHKRLDVCQKGKLLGSQVTECMNHCQQWSTFHYPLYYMIYTNVVCSE